MYEHSITSLNIDKCVKPLKEKVLALGQCRYSGAGCGCWLRTGAELGFKIWRGQIEKKKFEEAKTIKITKFRGKIN
jgi:hypothetical protein